jgi:hypothetical protein
MIVVLQKNLQKERGQFQKSFFEIAETITIEDKCFEHLWL